MVGRKIAIVIPTNAEESPWKAISPLLLLDSVEMTKKRIICEAKRSPPKDALKVENAVPFSVSLKEEKKLSY